MMGENTMILNNETMTAAVEQYLNNERRVGGGLKVTSLQMTPGKAYVVVQGHPAPAKKGGPKPPHTTGDDPAKEERQ